MFIGAEQPATCPQCGRRTEIINNLDSSQHHKCILGECSFEFILEFDDLINL